jgi:hypothetical protein
MCAQNKNNYNTKDWYLYEYVKCDSNNAAPLTSKYWLLILCVSTKQAFLVPRAFTGTVSWLNPFHVILFKKILFSLNL